VLRGLMEVAGVPHELENAALVAVDKLDKIGLERVRGELIERGIPPEAAERLLASMAASPRSRRPVLRWLGDLLAVEPGRAGRGGAAAGGGVQAVGPAAEHLRIDPYLARGLSYYTGPIFEIEFPGLSGSGGGGGRYDDLVGMFLGQAIPACGFSLGLERILLIMEERGMFPPRLAGQPQVLVSQFNAETATASFRLALRAARRRAARRPLSRQ
jgi:histidyl-tRNA synthetase